MQASTEAIQTPFTALPAQTPAAGFAGSERGGAHWLYSSQEEKDLLSVTWLAGTDDKWFSRG